jgi:secreted trypsin-like serine protease
MRIPLARAFVLAGTASLIVASGCSKAVPAPTEAEIKAEFDQLATMDVATAPDAPRKERQTHILEQKLTALQPLSALVTSPARQAAAAALMARTKRQQAAAALVHPNERIVGGREVADDAQFARLFPYQVAVTFAGFPNAYDGRHCGGSLIAKDWVLTAAHCFIDGNQSDDFRVYAGSRLLSAGGTFVDLIKGGLYPHPQFNRQTFDNDAALLHLASPLAQAPVALADAALEILLAHNATISGWGDTTPGSRRGSDVLVYAPIPLVDGPTCTKQYAAATPPLGVATSMVCAGNGSIDSCQGDSGGPLVLRKSDGSTVLAGVTSWGIGCAMPKFPGVYTRVSQFATWINQCMASGGTNCK